MKPPEIDEATRLQAVSIESCNEQSGRSLLPELLGFGTKSRRKKVERAARRRLPLLSNTRGGALADFSRDHWVVAAVWLSGVSTSKALVRVALVETPRVKGSLGP